MKAVEVNYNINWDFLPVGQGLFTTGKIKTGINDQKKEFRWIYDCGTSSRQQLITNQIDLYTSGLQQSEKIHLVVLSHFDKDHISGLTYLLSKSKIHTLMLPYIPLWKRMILAFEQGIKLSSKYMSFYLDPIKYIVEMAQQSSLDNIVFIQNGMGHDKEKQPASENFLEIDRMFEGLSNEEIIGGVHTRMTFDPSPDGEAGEEKTSFDSSASAKKINVRFLKRCSNIVIEDIWEFVPYNDDLIKTPSKTFVKKVSKQREVLLHAKSKALRNIALNSIKKSFDDYFGKSSKQRNIISMYLYGGTLSDQECKNRVFIHYSKNTLMNRHVMHGSFGSDKTGVLYTGDGFVENMKKFKRLRDNLTDQRIKNIFCLQVMHHGSRHNWFSGLASLFNPAVSIFSSDPNRKRPNHPHAEVLKDFLQYNPIQVDSQSKFSIQYYFVSKK